MLTPQEVRDKEFSKAVFSGYNMAEVDDFLEILTEDYAALYKESALLKSKLKLLVEKVESYRSTEDSMRAALLSAQKMAEDIVNEAKKKSEQLVSGTDDHLQEKISAINQEIDTEQYRLDKAREQTSLFVGKIRELYTQQLAMLDGVPSIEPPSAPPVVDADRIADTAKIIESSIMQITTDRDPSDDDAPEPESEPDAELNEEAAEPPAEFQADSQTDEDTFVPVRPKKVTAQSTDTMDFIDIDVDEDDDDDDDDQRPKFDFDNLKFGKDFKIK